MMLRLDDNHLSPTEGYPSGGWLLHTDAGCMSHYRDICVIHDPETGKLRATGPGPPSRMNRTRTYRRTKCIPWYWLSFDATPELSDLWSAVSDAGCMHKLLSISLAYTWVSQAWDHDRLRGHFGHQQLIAVRCPRMFPPPPSSVWRAEKRKQRS